MIAPQQFCLHSPDDDCVHVRAGPYDETRTREHRYDPVVTVSRRIESNRYFYGNGTVNFIKLALIDLYSELASDGRINA